MYHALTRQVAKSNAPMTMAGIVTWISTLRFIAYTVERGQRTAGSDWPPLIIRSPAG